MLSIDQSLKELMRVEGAIGCCVVDWTSGLLLGSLGDGSLDLDLAGAGNTEVIRAKMKTAKSLGFTDSIEDILITLDSQLHIIRPMRKHEGLFIYIALDRERANLALSRRKVLDIEKRVSI
jgi:predicted regulator of Ras-like GTPase activity (Roadblock/LC7/MglB family)